MLYISYPLKRKTAVCSHQIYQTVIIEKSSKVVLIGTNACHWHSDVVVFLVLKRAACIHIFCQRDTIGSNFPSKSRVVTVKTKAISTGTPGLTSYCSRTICIDKTLALYCPFNGMQNDFMALIHFLTAFLCNIFTSPLHCRPGARQCWLC